MKTRTMRRAAAFLSASAICLGAVQIGAFARTNTDINSDGQSNVQDVRDMVSALLGTSGAPQGSDLNGDGKVNAKDLTILKHGLLYPEQAQGREPNLPATMYSNFRAGDAGDFFSSAGWTNGRPFDCYWDKTNSQIKGDHLELRIDRNNDPNITAEDYETHGTWYPGYSGGEFRTEKYYSYGYYETSMKAIKNDGVVSSFFTYTGPSDVINGKKNPWDEIDIEILGKDTTKMQINYYRESKGGHEQMIDLGFDAAEAYHTYGFDWQPDKITWYVDGKAVGEMTGDMPKTASKIMMNAWPGRGVDDWLKPFNGHTGLVACYEWVTYHKADNAQDPMTLDELEKLAKQGQQGQENQNNGMNANATMVSNFSAGQAGDFFASDGWCNGRPFDCYWTKNNAAIRNNLLELNINAKDNQHNDIYGEDYETHEKWYPNYSGGEFRTNSFYHYGYYETSMKAIKNDGVVSSFFTYTGPSDVVNGQKNPWDEIDIEILGKDTTKVQLNYYRDGKGGHEYMYDLGFDASQDFHRYGFDWQPDHITWYVDGKEAYTMWGDVPKTPGKIMMNAWPGRKVDEWLKPFNGRTGLTAYYQWVTYNKDGR